MSSAESRLLRFLARHKGGSSTVAETLSFAEIGVAIGSNTGSVTDEYFRSTLREVSERWREKLLTKLGAEGVI